jgi:integrase
MDYKVNGKKSIGEDNARQGFFEQWKYEAVLAKLPDYLRPAATFAYHTGWRLRSEVLKLTWQQVDLDAGTVRLEVRTTKNKDERLIYLTDELRVLLLAQRQEQLAHYPDCLWVFPWRGKRVEKVNRSWNRASREAGLSGKIPHDFRRTAVRNMVRAGVPERVAMQMSGHKTRSVFDRYHNCL